MSTTAMLHRAGALALGIALALSTRVSGDDEPMALPIGVPERPFLLVEAPRRYLPTEAVELRVQAHDLGEVEVALFRVHAPLELLARGRERQGMAIAQTPLGRESERLIAASTPLPRVGTGLTLVEHRASRVHRMARRGVARQDESIVYDSYEDEESGVDTAGVESGNWDDARVALGRLPVGLYLARVTYGGWAGSALVSVGHNALMVRRGDLHDEIRVLGNSGSPRANVRIEARDGSSVIAHGTTDREGALRLPASDRVQLRFVAIDGDDVSWADVSHARASPCDPRVYLGTGRPVFRPREIVHVRGHVRGCDEAGNEQPLAGEAVELSPTATGEPVTVRSDAHGNFTAELVAREAELRATVRNHLSRRDLQLDQRQLPARALHVSLDRDWAAAGQTVSIRVADDEGGWPDRATVEIRTPDGVRRAPIGPQSPARASFVVPPTPDVIHRIEVVATLATPGRVQTARAEIWTGQRDEIVELQAARAVGRTGERIPVRIAVTDLRGELRAGEVVVTVSPSDGNRATGRARSRATLTLAGDAIVHEVALDGRGPWWIEARRGAATSTLVIRDRPSPPTLSERGELALRPAMDHVEPGATLPVDVRIEPGSTVWLTLEQGSVHASTLVRGHGGVHRVTLPVPAASRGMATVVATEVRGARIRSASASVEVATSRPFGVVANADRRVYAEGEPARVVIEARDEDSRPRDAVVSVWMADAGYWELGEERYPSADGYFRLPGRPASAGDGATPVAYGVEEGRFVDAWMEWNGAGVEDATFRHAWQHGGRFVRVSKEGDAREVLTELARAAGLREGRICDEAVAALGRVSLRAQDLPWDLVAVRAHASIVAALEGTDVHVSHPYVHDRALVFECHEGGQLRLASAGPGGSSIGYGAGAGGLGVGFGSGPAREERLDGTLFFLADLPLGPDGREVIEVPLPAHPGRWRIEVLAIASDGAGASAAATVHTTRPITLTLHAPSRMREGDVSDAALEISAPTLAGRTVAIETDVHAGIELLAPMPASVVLDARGRVRLATRLRARTEGVAPIAVRATCDGQHDAVGWSIDVVGPATRQPIAFRTVVGPSATEVQLPLPTVLRDTTIHVRAGADVLGAVQAQLDELRQPRWGLSVLRLDRLAALAALRRAVASTGSSLLAIDVDRAIAGEAAAVLRSAHADAAGDGSVSWWGGLERDPAMTAGLLYGLGDRVGDAGIAESAVRALESLQRATDRGTVTAHAAPVVAAALARADDHDRARRLLTGAAIDELDAMVWALRAAAEMRDPTAPYAVRIERELDARLAGGAPIGSRCAGRAWFLCLARASERSQLARAAEALLTAGRDRDRAARVAERIAIAPVETAWWSWGSSDADVIALIARLEGAGSTRATIETIEIVRGDRVIARVRSDGDGGVALPAGSGDLIARFERARGRFAMLRIDGEIDVPHAQASSGSVPLERRIVEDDGERFLEVEVTLATDARDVSIATPFPAGLELAIGTGGGRIGVRGEGRRWNWWTGNPDAGPEVPTVIRGEDGIELRWSRLQAGRTVVRVPVIVTSSGSFTAGPARLRAADASTWALTPPLAITL